MDVEGDLLKLDDGADVAPGLLDEWLGDALGHFDVVDNGECSVAVCLNFVSARELLITQL